MHRSRMSFCTLPCPLLSCSLVLRVCCFPAKICEKTDLCTFNAEFSAVLPSALNLYDDIYADRCSCTTHMLEGGLLHVQ